MQKATYTPNSLNQYVSRTVPGYVDVFGTANSSATVTVNNQTTYRKGEYYRKELSVANGSAPQWVGITNVAVINQGGGNPDLVTSTTDRVFVAKSPENFTYDADGNLTSDGLWTYTWDGENRLKTMAMASVRGMAFSNRLRLEFTYDFLGRRMEKVVGAWDGSAFTNSVTNRFVYDGWTTGRMQNGHECTESRPLRRSLSTRLLPPAVRMSMRLILAIQELSSAPVQPFASGSAYLASMRIKELRRL